MMLRILTAVKICLMLLVSLACTPVQAQAVEIVMWHSLAGGLGEEVNHLADAFNKSQDDYLVKPVYKGEYTDSLTSFAAAFRAKKPPAMVQVFEVGTAIMLSPVGIIKPLDSLLREQHVELPEDNFLSAVRAFYSKEGQLQAMPFNISVPLVYYNADALAQVGVSDKDFPRTWQELELLAEKLQKAGFGCAYTSAYPAWIQIESFASLHNLPLVDSKLHAVYNHPAVINHLQRLKNWQNKGYLKYGGRTSDATVLFTSGQCVMFSQSSGSYSSMSRLVSFRLGVAPLPVDAKVTTTRHNNVAGGAALWTVAGHSDQVYRGVALFYAFLARPDVQWRWHQQTGYIPIGLSGVYTKHQEVKVMPSLDIALLDLAVANTHNSLAWSLPLNQIRMVNDQSVEAIFAGIKTPAEAMNDAVARADFIIRRFSLNTRDGK